MIILLVNLAIRIPRFDYPLSYIFAWGDGTRDYLVANHILTSKEYPLVGPYNLLNEVGIKNSPVYFYLLAAILTPFNNILTLSFVNILLQIAVIVLIYLTVKKLFDTTSALIAVSLFSFNPEVIKQADFVWQPTLMQPVALLAVYLLIRGYLDKKFSLVLISLAALSLAIALHNSAAPWLPLFLLISIWFVRKSSLPLAVSILSLLLLYLPLLIYYFKNPTSLVPSWVYITSLSSYLTNFNINLTQLMHAFYLDNIYALILVLLVIFNFTFIKDKAKYHKLVFWVFLFFITPIIFASFFNKIKLHYLYLSFTPFVILVAAILGRFQPLFKLILALFFIIIFSGNFAQIKEFKKPLENQAMMDNMTNALISELQEVKQQMGFAKFNFFQVLSIVWDQKTFEGFVEYPILDTLLLVPLEEKLHIQLTTVSDNSPYNHIQINRKDFLLVSCHKFQEDKERCGDYFLASYPNYSLIKTLYQNSHLSVYLAKQHE